MVKSFSSPQEAAQALVDAAKSDKNADLVDIFGAPVKEWILSGDPVQDQQAKQRFLNAYAEKSAIEPAGADKAILVIGSDDFPFPFPLVKSGDRWSFDPDLGKQKVLDRRIGRNEPSTIQVLLAIVDAQREYAERDWDGNGILEYAKTIRSKPGEKDGLYWEERSGEPSSPIGPLVATAVREGYVPKSGDTSGPTIPYHGYQYRMLLAQGSNAPGGAYSYVVKRQHDRRICRHRLSGTLRGFGLQDLHGEPRRRHL